MSPRRAHRSTAIALLIGSVVCVLVALGSTLSPLQLISAGPPPVDAPPPTLPPGTIPTGEPAYGLPDLPQPADRLDLGWLLQIVVTLVIVAALLALVLVVVRAARALAGRRTPEPIDDVVDAPTVDARALQDVLRAAREQIDLDGDAERAVIRCWEALESLGAHAGVPRTENQTATDYVVGMLAAFDLPRDAAERLARLYARALFSPDRLDARDVEEARADLARLDGAHAASAAAGVATPTPGADA